MTVSHDGSERFLPFLGVFRVKNTKLRGHGALRWISREIFFFSAAVACGDSAKKKILPILVVTDSPIGRRSSVDRTASETFQIVVKHLQKKKDVWPECSTLGSFVTVRE